VFWHTVSPLASRVAALLLSRVMRILFSGR
jgi:hypothetical protein